MEIDSKLLFPLFQASPSLTFLLQPKYWCKHCKTYVRDTKLERTNHDATPKHQSSIKRFLHGLHRGHERDERDKQRAKDEVGRLNGIVSGTLAPAGISTEDGAPWRRKPAITPANNELRQATPTDRKRQLAQLAEMGVAIPEEFRREMAMAGDWQTLSERPAYEILKAENGTEDRKYDGLNIGVRKRKFEGQDEEEAAGETVARKGWGSTIRVYPDKAGEDDDLDFLLGKNLANSKTRGESDGHLDSNETVLKKPVAGGDYQNEPISQHKPDTLLIKSEDVAEDDKPQAMFASLEALDETSIKPEGHLPEPEIMFKKRKARPIRNK